MHQYVLSVDDSLIYLYFRTTEVPEEKFSCHFIYKKSTNLFWAPRMDMLEMACCTLMISSRLHMWSTVAQYTLWTCNVLCVLCHHYSRIERVCNQFLFYVTFICICSISKTSLKHLGTDGESRVAYKFQNYKDTDQTYDINK